MKIKELQINNFRQYYGKTAIDLTTENNKNIVIIGGKNGYGKTNLLLSIVWALYGDKISQIDENFKREIQKEKNYAQFMKQSLNWTAQKRNNSKFSVDLIITDIEVPKIKTIRNNINEIKISREFDVVMMNEKLSITDPNTETELFDDEYDKINFINDYIIPLDAAKFVFFDAEKIAEIANFSTKEEGSFLNDALGKILGLDIYEDLLEDIESYKNTLKKEIADKNIKDQIADKENAIKISNIEIEHLQESNGEIQKAIDEIKKKIRALELNIKQLSKESDSSFDREIILSQIQKLEEEEKKLELTFNELSELIPLAILTGKLEEVYDHLTKQEKNDLASGSSSELIDRVNLFIERLFNHPPEPMNSAMSMQDKFFYYQKAKGLGIELFNQNEEQFELEFEHDLNNAEKDLIKKTLNVLNTQSNDSFEAKIDDFNSVKLKIQDLKNTLNKIDADLEDELISEYISKKENLERNMSDYFKTMGSNNEKVGKLEKDIVKINQSYQTLLKKVGVDKKNKAKIDTADKYKEVLKKFISSQKELKKESLAQNILAEMRKLMHKLNENNNHFVSKIVVTILAESGGMKTSLYNSEEEEIKKEVLSQGEKQIYISSLIKAILKESIQPLPIFIDTPLGRLDNEHIKNILLYYYPDLSDQVVILSTNNEITPKRYHDISENVSKAYLLNNDGANTIITKGYFN